MQQTERWSGILADVERAQGFLDLVCSSAIADYRGQGGSIFCAKGCASCCTLAVNCTAAEALRVAMGLSEPQRERLRSHVARLKELVGGVADLKGYLRLHRQELGGCPFLEDDSCGIYPLRPLSCRALLSTRESYWCGVDFSGLSAAEKGAFMESLDRSVVAFPLHYLASVQETGRSLEMQAAMQMTKEFGFSLYGSMPVLVHLFCDRGLADSFEEGAGAVMAVVAAAGFGSPFILQLETL